MNDFGPPDRNSVPDDDPYHSICWSCQKEFEPGLGIGISIDESGEEQVCKECWEFVPVTARLWIGLLFRKLDAGGFGIQNMIEEVLNQWPIMGRGPSDRPSKN